jgi:GH35 family endo-1,4-beta-xylanase
MTYDGRDANAPWRALALARIEQLRKGDFTIHVTDATGRPIAGAPITVTMQRHAFAFGTALQMARIVQDSPDNRMYRQKVAALFNAGTTENDLKWQPWIGEWGSGYARAQTLAGLRWLANRGFQLRGHNFVWPGWTAPTTNLPNAVIALRGTTRQGEIPQMVLDHIADEATATRDVINEWDVQNEPYDNHDLMDVFGPAIQVDWFKAARAALPTGALYLNDYNIEDQTRNSAHIQLFENTVRYLLQNGAPLTGLGLQSHISAVTSAPIGMPNFLATLDRYAAEFSLPMRITEFDVNTADTALQADYTRDFLTASFSHPSIAGIQFWGFWQGAHWRPDAALFRTDWSEKPNGAVYRDLVFNQWWTRLTGTTNTQGNYSGRGFYGDYVTAISVNGATIEKTFSISAGAPAPTIAITATAPRLANLATRAPVGTTGDLPIAGFVVAGASSKLVLVRGIGPSLAAFGISGPLARPTLTLYHGTQVFATNTGWSTAPNASAIAAVPGPFPLPTNSADSALLLRLDPGDYTARVSSADGGVGIALVEAYEVETDATRFANVSTRGFVGSGDALLIPGFVVSGASARTFLIRAIGPGLTDFGVTGVLNQPSLVLMRDNAAVAANDRWETAPDPAALAAAASKVGAFTLKSGSADAAVLVTLEPGSYTAVVSGANGGTGNCLVEFYEVSP